MPLARGSRTVHPWPPAFGARLRSLRERHRLTQEDMATVLEIDRAHLSNLERGKTLPSVPLLVALARELRVSTDFLLGLRGRRRKIAA